MMDRTRNEMLARTFGFWHYVLLHGAYQIASRSRAREAAFDARARCESEGIYDTRNQRFKDAVHQDAYNAGVRSAQEKHEMLRQKR